MESGKVLIREARIGDGQAIGNVHIQTWLTAYRGIVPDQFLDSLLPESSGLRWEKRLQDLEPNTVLYVAEIDGLIVGFASGGPQRDGPPQFQAEVYAIYILEAHQGKGIGRALVRAAAHKLSEFGYDSLLIWVLVDNKPARGFYSALGGEELHTKQIEIGGEPLDEVAYGWRDISSLLA